MRLDREEIKLFKDYYTPAILQNLRLRREVSARQPTDDPTVDWTL